MPYLGSSPPETALEADDIASNAVTTAKIANDAVDTDKINLVSTGSTPSLEAKGTSGVSEGYIQLNCAENSHGIKLKSPPHSAGQSYTLTFPSSIVTDGFMKTDGSGNLSFAAAGGGFEFVSSTTASSSSTIDFAGLSGNNDYMVVFSNLKHSEDADLGLRFGASTTYITANYQHAVLRNTQETVQAEANDGSGQNAITMTRGVTGGGTTEIITGYCMIFDLADSSFNTTATFHLSGESNGSVEEQNIGAGRYEVNAALTDIRFFPSAGNFTSGAIRLYKRASA